jgi:hypothetical protein
MYQDTIFFNAIHHQILIFFSFNFLSKLKYSNSSIIMEYDDFVKFSASKNYDFWFEIH